MATWTFTDGSQVSSGGKVVGDQVVARNLREDFNELRYPGGRRSIELGIMPGGLFVFNWADLKSSDWVLNLYLSSFARQYAVSFTTDYVPTDADLPQKARDFFARQELVRHTEAQRQPEPDGEICAH